MPTGTLDIKTLLFCCLLIGSLCAWIAQKNRGRKPLPWFFLGFFFGCLALIALFLLPKQPLTLNSTVQDHSFTPTAPPLEHTSPMTKELWYYLTEDQKQIGPLTFQGLKKMYAEGKLTLSSYVWNGSLAEWKTLHELPDYLSLLQQPSA